MVVQDLRPVPVVGEVVARAGREASAAARAAHVDVRPATADDELRALIAVGEAVWGPGGTLSPNEMRALEHAGAPVHGAWVDGVGAVGFAVGFLGWRGGLHVHSHQTGVLDAWRRTGVGYALKLAQRAACLEHGVVEVRWTFDPMVRRNAAFNLHRLGARAARFVPDFYGRMEDAINSADRSDRLEAVWRLEEPLPDAGPGASGRPARGPAGDPEARTPVLVDDGGVPRLVADPARRSGHLAVPGDYERLRREDPDRALAWRLAVRGALIRAYAAGLAVVAVDAEGYLLGDGRG